MTEALADVLKARKSVHGDFTDHARCAQELKHAYNRNRKSALTVVQEEAIAMILHKIARIASGDPNHADHWVDIAGYATLVVDRL